MSRLWERGEPLEAKIALFTVGRDPELDLRLVPHDALASAAHAVMLEEIGVLARGEARKLRRELATIVRDARGGRFRIRPEQEDGHTAIENRLVRKLGEPGRKIHAGRSRNDQVLAALRLWGREAVLAIHGEALETASLLLELARRHRETSMPGYSHGRQAMPTTLGHVLAAHAEGLRDGLPWLETAFAHLNRSPLGAASGFGVALPLDRERVGELLAFDSVQPNTLAVQNDRGTGEFLALGAASAVALPLGRLAADLLLFSSDELGFVRLASEVTTGSSIMPQKRNPDVLELIRAGVARLPSRQAEIAAIVGALPSGYHRDLQLTKEPFLDGLELAAAMLGAMRPVLDTLEVDAEACRRAILPATGATDALYARVRAGEPFRTAYGEVARDPAAAVTGDPAEAWRERTHLGAPGALDLAPARRALRRARRWAQKRRTAIVGVWRLLDRP